MGNPICARKGAYQVTVEAGKRYFYCTCGRSRTQPFCDGSHEGTGFTPWPFTASTSGTVAMCGCKRTSTTPFCDGSHKTLDD